MKRIFIFIIIIITTIALTSCIPFRLSKLNFETTNERKLAEEMIKEIVKCIEDNDAESLKNLFSENAKKNAVNFDEGIEHVLETYQGHAVYYEDKLGSTYENNHYGDKEIHINRSYLVKTEVETYIFDFSIWKSDFDIDDNGLYQLRILTEQDDDEKSILWIMQYGDTPGILWEDTLTPNDYLASATRALSNGINDSLYYMYSKEIRESIPDFEEKIKDVITKFRGYADYDEFPDVTVLSTENDGFKTIIKAECELDTKTFDRTEDITYLIYFIYSPFETDKEGGGFYSIQICEKIDENSELIITDEPGIFYQSID